MPKLQEPEPQRRIIRKPRVRALTGQSDTTIWRQEQYAVDPFPQRIRLNADGSAVGWYEDEVLEWIQRRVRGVGKKPGTRTKQSKSERIASLERELAELRAEGAARLRRRGNADHAPPLAVHETAPPAHVANGDQGSAARSALHFDEVKFSTPSAPLAATRGARD